MGGWTWTSPSLSGMRPMRSLRPFGSITSLRQGMGTHFASRVQGEIDVERTALQYTFNISRDLDMGPLFA